MGIFILIRRRHNTNENEKIVSEKGKNRSQKETKRKTHEKMHANFSRESVTGDNVWQLDWGNWQGQRPWRLQQLTSSL